MHEANDFKVPKWPFFFGDALMLGVAYFVFWQSTGALVRWEVITICACVALGAFLGIVPFVMEHRGLLRFFETSALGTVSEKIQNLDRVAAQITAASGQWEMAQLQADKTAATAKEIADRMTSEVQEFNKFLHDMNDTEKATLRLEVEKLRRAEGEWVQILVRTLDHVFALYSAAERSGQPQIFGQISHFQNACRDTARRIGLVPFAAAPDEPFDKERHKWADGEEAADGAIVSETLATGYTFQGRQVRPALVRLRQEAVPETTPAEPEPDQGQLPIEPAPSEASPQP